MKYSVTYKSVDFDAEVKVYGLRTWADTCRFMKSLLDDGYQISAVNG